MIYFDNSATTKINAKSLDTYVKVSEKIWGNPSSLHSFGEQSFHLLQQSRQQIANLLDVKMNEIYFTSGGTEGDNWIIKGTALAKQEYGKHIITTSIEHPAVINACQQLERQGFEVTYLPVDENGRISISALKEAIRKDTILVSVMLVNNEIGSIQPTNEVAEYLKKFPSIHFHVDAVQGIGKGLKFILKNNRIDFLTFSGHKFHAPRGIGFIYKKFGRHIMPLMDGGGQESNLRSGTENLPAIAAMAKSLRLLLENEAESVNKQRSIKEKIYNHLSQFENVTIFSKLNYELFAPHILCFAISGVRGETIVHAFESNDIYISTTSACSSKKNETSGTLSAMQVPQSIADSAVRISLDENNTLEEAKMFNRVFDSLYKKFSKING
ncbi:cysteine desulfurase [Apilactobacillus sp. TMW 2.2459]|uniref:cysteine desulfurase family protein n=1 Tax=Apilactobacillus xinyiensis TaxID=2841032 RepID=UPI001C7CFB90|nr:cysteine desulfurase family protein [Apilactobacillus xinyiensis]MCL0311595.1 cysteine desulfurase [Apilactobacillus xinyiensis]